MSPERPGGPTPKDEIIKRRMQNTRQRDTGPERKLRSMLHGWGLRFRVDKVPVPGMRSRADIVFTRHRIAVFVDGCFWHGCPAHGTMPKNNEHWWRAKIEANKARDRRVDEVLRNNGWRVVRMWEHDVSEQAAASVAQLIPRRS